MFCNPAAQQQQNQQNQQQQQQQQQYLNQQNNQLAQHGANVPVVNVQAPIKSLQPTPTFTASVFDPSKQPVQQQVPVQQSSQQQVQSQAQQNQLQQQNGAKGKAGGAPNTQAKQQQPTQQQQQQQQPFDVNALPQEQQIIANVLMALHKQASDDPKKKQKVKAVDKGLDILLVKLSKGEVPVAVLAMLIRLCTDMQNKDFRNATNIVNEMATTHFTEVTDYLSALKTIILLSKP